MPKKYHFWISGCQMNYADARQVADRLEALGYEPTASTDEASVIVLQTCTVRQQSEDKAYGRLMSLRPLKESDPGLTLAMMGCVVGVKGNEALRERFPYVDVWLPPASDGSPLVSHLLQDEDRSVRLYSIEALRRITGTDFGYDYKDAAHVRAIAVERWHQFLETEQSRHNQKESQNGKE